MNRDEHLLQLLKQEFSRHLAWFSSKTATTVTLRPSGHGHDFTLVATWDGGEHVKRYSATDVQRLGGRGGCAAKMAEQFIQETITRKRTGT